MSICPRCQRPTWAPQKDTGLCPYCVTGYKPFEAGFSAAVARMENQPIGLRAQFTDWHNPPETIQDEQGRTYYLLADFSTECEHRYRRLHANAGEAEITILRDQDE